jgi:hypothetical protein
MHNCKKTKERFTELLLDGVDCRSDAAISAELNRCAECREEFDALSATLRTTNRTAEMAVSVVGYWPGYHSKLRQRLVHLQDASINSRAQAQRHKDEPGPLLERLRPGAGMSLLATFFKTSVRVPLPLGITLVVTAALLLAFAIRAARTNITPSNNITIVRVPVEVPVVQEKIQAKIVTRVIYRERSSTIRPANQATEAARTESTFARSQKPQTETLPVGLSGFKPSEEIKLTVIKGGVPNEK